MKGPQPRCRADADRGRRLFPPCRPVRLRSGVNSCSVRILSSAILLGYGSTSIVLGPEVLLDARHVVLHAC